MQIIYLFHAIFQFMRTLAFDHLCSSRKIFRGMILHNSLIDNQLRKYRLVTALEYMSTFSSDRSHMIRPDGSFSSPPPSYPLIQISGLFVSFIQLTAFRH
jgi:hypothetical protein